MRLNQTYEIIFPSATGHSVPNRPIQLHTCTSRVIFKHSIQASRMNLESYRAQHPSTHHWHRVRVRVGGSALGAKRKTFREYSLSWGDHASTTENGKRHRALRYAEYSDANTNQCFFFCSWTGIKCSVRSPLKKSGLLGKHDAFPTYTRNICIAHETKKAREKSTGINGRLIALSR